MEAYLHAMLDLIIFGDPYFDLHKKIDKASQVFGKEHRIISHDWYQAYGKLWTSKDPFPTKIRDYFAKFGEEFGPNRGEEEMVRICHSVMDKKWDSFTLKEKQYWKEFLIEALFSPEKLRNWAKVDVLKGRIHRKMGEKEIWEDCPKLPKEYKRLKKYVEAVWLKDKRCTT